MTAMILSILAALSPAAFLAALWFLLTEPERHRRRLERDPNEPWNVAARFAREQERWYLENYKPLPGSRDPS